MDNQSDDWSPADNPYAIAVSEAQWWREAAKLAIERMRRGDDYSLSRFGTTQIDARQLIFALRQLLTAEELEQSALKRLKIERPVRKELRKARQRFEDALPGIKEMRDGLVHFDEWSRGLGRRGPQVRKRNAGCSIRDVAREYWGFAFDRRRNTVTFGPYVIDIEAAERTARDLCGAIYTAACEVDNRAIARLRVEVLDALASARISCNSPDTVLKVSNGEDQYIWLSLSTATSAEIDAYRDVAASIVAALGSAGLRVTVPSASHHEPVERLACGEPVYAEYLP